MTQVWVDPSLRLICWPLHNKILSSGTAIPSSWEQHLHKFLSMASHSWTSRSLSRNHRRPRGFPNHLISDRKLKRQWSTMDYHPWKWFGPIRIWWSSVTLMPSFWGMTTRLKRCFPPQKWAKLVLWSPREEKLLVMGPKSSVLLMLLGQTSSGMST